jgi:putative transposase
VQAASLHVSQNRNRLENGMSRGGEIVTRRNLPHWYQPGFAHFITYRLADSIPTASLVQWREERETDRRHGPQDGMPKAAFRTQLHKEHFRKYDEYLDTHDTRRWLADERVADVVRENLYHHNGVKYQLLAWCIMCNHVHVVLQPFEFSQAGSLTHETEGRSLSHVEQAASLLEIADTSSPLSSIMHSLKSFTANRANEILGRTGRFWQAESYDHWIREGHELERIVAYVIGNPVKAGLCTSPVEWRYSSAYDRFRRDGSLCGAVGELQDDWLRT